METRPTPQCRVRLRTKGTLEKGTLVDRHHSVPFTLGDGDVIQGGCGLLMWFFWWPVVMVTVKHSYHQTNCC